MIASFDRLKAVEGITVRSAEDRYAFLVGQSDSDLGSAILPKCSGTHHNFEWFVGADSAGGLFAVDQNHDLLQQYTVRLEKRVLSYPVSLRRIFRLKIF